MTGSTYAMRRDRVAAAVRAEPSTRFTLHKSVSNLFRDRLRPHARRLDVSDFTHVLGIDATSGWVDAEGMTTYDALTDACLREGVMPVVVPQLKSITLGGAAAGVGIEASSFRHGLVHESILDMDVLLADGQIVRAAPEGEHADLFYGLPNSYGTLGYALRLRVKTQPIRPFVHIERARYHDAATYFRDLAFACRSDANFVDGVVFDSNELVINTGRFVETAPYTSDYTYRNIFYRSIRTHAVDYLSTHDYLWRWDTDWFWCSKNFGAQHPLVRAIFGRRHLNSRTYTRLMRLNSRLGLTRAIDRLTGRHPESVIQDVDIPIAHAAEFLTFFLRDIGIRPIWVCPIRPGMAAERFTLYPMRAGELYVNFGFWDVVRAREMNPPGHFNRLIEREVERLGGIKSLYSDSVYTHEEFWQVFDRNGYESLKSRYDPAYRFGDLYDKCVLRH